MSENGREHIAKKPELLLLLVIFLGFLFDFLFWDHWPGVNFFIFTAASVLIIFIYLFSEGLRPAGRSLLLLLPVAFFSIMFFVRLEPMTVFLAFVMAIFSAATFIVTCREGSWFRYNIFDYILEFINLLISAIAGGADAAIKEFENRKGDGARRKATRAWPAVRGLLIAIPIVAVFMALLASADLVFAQRINDLFSLIWLDNVPEYLTRGFIIAIVAYLFSGVLFHSGGNRLDVLEEKKRPVLKPFLGRIEWTVILGSVFVLFAFFVIIQFQYFFGGESNINLEGYTYAEYARRGFGELVTVAIFSMLLLQGLSKAGQRETNRQQILFSGISTGIVVMVLVILVSAFQRLLLYEDAFGFSRLRTYTHVFIIWLGVLLVVFLILEILKRQRSFIFVSVLAAMGFVLSLGILNVDGFIVGRNVQRAIDGEEFDAGYLQSLSGDAIPSLIDAYRSSAVSPSQKDELGAALACMAFRRDKVNRVLDWQSFNFSRRSADESLAGIDSDIDDYQVTDGAMSLTVTSPEGKEYICEE